MQLYGGLFWSPQNLNIAPKMHVWAMQGCPFWHSSSCSQSCAVTVLGADVVHEPPLGTAWQSAEPESDDVFSVPQQLSPAGQSQEYRQ